jgi:hypothetical protein
VVEELVQLIALAAEPELGIVRVVARGPVLVAAEPARCPRRDRLVVARIALAIKISGAVPAAAAVAPVIVPAAAVLAAAAVVVPRAQVVIVADIAWVAAEGMAAAEVVAVEEEAGDKTALTKQH